MSTISLIILITPIVVKALLKPRLERGTLRRKKNVCSLKEMHLKFLFHSEILGGNYDFINA